MNHPRELSDAARAACARLIDAGIPLLSQSVLLKGVNDDVATLEALMRALVETRIQPYYLHHLDLAPGTSHFRVPIAEGQRLMRELRARASGLCQPHYVLDIPDGYAKALLNLPDIEQAGDSLRLRDAKGRWHPYPPPKSRTMSRSHSQSCPPPGRHSRPRTRRHPGVPKTTAPAARTSFAGMTWVIYSIPANEIFYEKSNRLALRAEPFLAFDDRQACLV